MSVYFVKGKGWRFDFTLEGIRYTEAWFETKKAAMGIRLCKSKRGGGPTNWGNHLAITASGYTIRCTRYLGIKIG